MEKKGERVAVRRTNATIWEQAHHEVKKTQK